MEIKKKDKNFKFVENIFLTSFIVLCNGYITEELINFENIAKNICKNLSFVKEDIKLFLNKGTIKEQTLILITIFNFLCYSNYINDENIALYIDSLLEVCKLYVSDSDRTLLHYLIAKVYKGYKDNEKEQY